MNIKELLVLSLFVFDLIYLSACGGSSLPSTVVSESAIQAKQETSALNSKLMMSAGSGGVESPADYIIGPADLLQIDVFESEKLTDKARVSSRGDITLPLIGNVHVGGLSAREAEVQIEDILKQQGFIKDPHVTVFIEEYNSKVVTVVGMVEEPGNHAITGRQTLLDVLVAAKGFQDKAGRTIIVNRTDDNGRKQTYMVDLDEMLLNGNSDLNIVLRPGDVIYVPQAGNVYIEGAVRKPGAYPIQKDLTTVSQVLVSAGGVANYADTSDIKLIRYEGKGERQIVQLDLAKIQTGEADDPIVKDRDALIVGFSTSKRLLYGLRLGLGFGLVNFGYEPPEGER